MSVQQIRLQVQGMTCAACATRVERVLGRIDGVSEALVNLITEEASVRFDPGVVQTAALVEAIDRAGFSVPPQVLRLEIGGMTCATCSGRVERVLRAAPGVLSAQVNLASEVATVAFVPGATSLDALSEVVERAGYNAQSVASDAEERAARDAAEAAKDRRERLILMGSALLSVPLVTPMVLMPLGVSWALPGWAQLALALPVQLGAGARFYRGAYASIRGGVANMDVLVALGTSAAFALSLFAMWSGGEPALPR